MSTDDPAGTAEVRDALAGRSLGAAVGIVLAIQGEEALVELPDGGLDVVALDLVPDAGEGELLLCLAGLVLERLGRADAPDGIVRGVSRSRAASRDTADGDRAAGNLLTRRSQWQPC
jgi:hypothetical protein